MPYECQSCYTKIDDNDISTNSLGDLQCPECGSFDIVELEDPEFVDEDPLIPFYDEDGIMDC